jgi:hypothetical protein
MIAALYSGHDDLSDWLLLIAAILFVLAGMIVTTQTPDRSKGALIPAGLALMAVALLVL